MPHDANISPMQAYTRESTLYCSIICFDIYDVCARKHIKHKHHHLFHFPDACRCVVPKYTRNILKMRFPNIGCIVQMQHQMYGGVEQNAYDAYANDALRIQLCNWGYCAYAPVISGKSSGWTFLCVCRTYTNFSKTTITKQQWPRVQFAFSIYRTCEYLVFRCTKAHTGWRSANNTRVQTILFNEKHLLDRTNFCVYDQDVYFIRKITIFK